MLTTLASRAQAAVMALFAALMSLTTERAAHRGMLTRRFGVVGARGVTFIEYALLAAIAVFIAWLFRDQLEKIFNNLLGSVTKATNDTRS